MENYPFDDVTPAPDAAPAESETVMGTGNPTASRARKIATGAAIGVVVLATGGVAIAATHTGSTTAQGGPGGGGPGGEGGFGGPPGTTSSGTTGTAPSTAGTGTGTAPTGRRGFGGPGGFGGLTDALHGTFVVPAASGTGTMTEDLQTGKVTAVSATSIAVTSTDKTVGTFVITSATKVNQGQSKISDVKVGDTVTVIATDADKKAVSVEDRSLSSTSGGSHGGGPGGAGGGFGGPPAAGAVPSTTGTAPSTTGGETT